MRIIGERLIFYGVLLMILVLGMVLVSTRSCSPPVPRLEVLPAEKQDPSR